MNLSDIIVGQLPTNEANGLVLLDGSGQLLNTSSSVWANPNTRIIYDQYNEQAFSTVSDSWNTDSSTTLIADPDFGYTAINGTLIVRQTIQLQSFGGSTALQLGNDGSIVLNGAGLNTAGGLLQMDGSGNIAFPSSAGTFAQLNSLSDTTCSGNLMVQGHSSLDYGDITTDGSGNLTLYNGGLQISAGALSVGGPSYLDNGSIYTDGGGNFNCNGQLTANTAVLGGLLFPFKAATTSAPAYVLGAIYFDTTLNKLRIGGASAWETVTSV